jgi:exonuclease SbcD
VFDTLLRLHHAGIRVVVIPGNHDSAARFEAFAGLLRPIGVDVVARVLPPDLRGIVEVPSRDGTQTAEVACVPFVPERRFGDAAALVDAVESQYATYAEGMGQLFAAMAAGFTPGRASILMAHVFTDGALVTPGGGERELTIGMAYAVPPSRLPGHVSYVALGHVHLPQGVKGSPAPARFAGSLLQLDFGEAGQRKSAVVAEIVPGRPARLEEVPIGAGRSLRDVRGTLDDVLRRGAEAGDDYLRAFVETDGPVPGIADRIRTELPNVMDVHLVYDRRESEPSAAPVSAMHPRAQFEAYYRAEHGADADVHLLEAFDEVLELETEGAA